VSEQISYIGYPKTNRRQTYSCAQQVVNRHCCSLSNIADLVYSIYQHRPRL